MGVPQNKLKHSSTMDVGLDNFYEIMGDFYGGEMRKHASPTKRLIQQKDAAFEHKKFLSKKI